MHLIHKLFIMTFENFRNIPFRLSNLDAIYPGCKDMAHKATRLENNGTIIRLKKGMYVASTLASRANISEYLIANHLHGPSYISMHTALRYYSLIPEAVQETISITAGHAKKFTNFLGTFRYIHAQSPYYSIGVTSATEEDTNFLIATKEKALCDLLVFTPNLNLRYKGELTDYIENNLRFDMDEFKSMDVEIIKKCALCSRKKNMLNNLAEIISSYGRNF